MTSEDPAPSRSRFQLGTLLPSQRTQFCYLPRYPRDSRSQGSADLDDNFRQRVTTVEAQKGGENPLASLIHDGAELPPTIPANADLDRHSGFSRG